MIVKVRAIDSLQLIPENDSDVAVLNAMIKMNVDKDNRFYVQSYGSKDGVTDSLCFGFQRIIEMKRK